MLWHFAKYAACRNDFVLFDNRKLNFPLEGKEMIQKICDRRSGIGADGVLLLENSSQADFRMRIFNSDGGEAEMCGNGLRCLVRWLSSLGFQAASFRIETMHRIFPTSLKNELVEIEMGPAGNIQWDIPFSYENQSLLLHFLDTGVPHIIFFTEEIETINLMKWGATVRNHQRWQPFGVNGSLVQVIHPQKIKLRTYERGVENETPACGTGAVAAALAAAHQFLLQSPIAVETQSGEELRVAFSPDFSHITLSGRAEPVFYGQIDLFHFFL